MASYASPTRLQGLLQVMQRWPRDTRDTLFMLAVIAWVLLPQVSHLPLWCSLTAAAVLLWRAALTLTGRQRAGMSQAIGRSGVRTNI